jgi:hypothetical protein
MRKLTTIIITKCDNVKQRGDYFLYSKEDQFNLPEDYNEIDEDIREDLF